MSEKFSGVRIVSELALEMRERLIALSGPREWSDTRESWLARGARKAGITYRTAKALFYNESSDPRASTVERLRAATDEQEALHAARREYADLCQRIERVETLCLSFADQGGSQGHPLGKMDRGVDRAVD